MLHYVVLTVGRPSGSGEIEMLARGRRRVHYTFNDRGRGPDVHSELAFDARGALVELRASGHGYEKDPIDEQLVVRDGELVWHSPAEHGRARAGSGFFVPASDSLGALAGLVRGLRAAPEHRVPLLPGGEARLEADLAVEVALAGQPVHLHQVAIAGFDFVPMLVWVDDDGEVFAQVSPWFSLVRAGNEALVPQLVAADERWTAARAERLAHTLAHPAPGGLAITHARLFDSERETIVPDATVIVAGDRIAAVGDASTPIPAGARVVDAHGKTLIPGLWDMHVHLGPTDGLLELASGVTSVRDLGNDIADLGTRVARFESGQELGPRVVRAGLIDGPGKLAAPTGVLAATRDEAVAAVEKFAKLGYEEIKIYSSVDPKLVAPIAEAAHAHGLRVTGHVPNGMTAQQVAVDGYDEIQHINFLFLPFMTGPGDDTRTPLRYVRVAERGGSLDLASKPVQDLLGLLATRHVAVDPTLVVFEAQFTSDPGTLVPAFATFAGRLPAQVERGARQGSLDAPGNQRAVFRASFAALLHMVKLARERGVTILAGTDIGGLGLPRELELLVQAGLPAPDVLAIATIGAARQTHHDRERGSIAVGKQADLVLVDGDPTADIAALRRARLVVCRGIVYDPAELLGAAGIKP